MDNLRIKVPSAATPWGPEIIAFALSYNGYDRHGDPQSVKAVVEPVRRSWQETKQIRGDLSTLRCALFFEQRAAHHTDSAPDAEYLAALLTAIGTQSGGWVEGPADPYP